jgi:hypothetical protein
MVSSGEALLLLRLVVPKLDDGGVAANAGIVSRRRRLLLLAQPVPPRWLLLVVKGALLLVADDADDEHIEVRREKTGAKKPGLPDRICLTTRAAAAADGAIIPITSSSSCSKRWPASGALGCRCRM